MSEKPDQGEKPAGMRRGVRILLFASLAMNLLVVGLVLGAAAAHRFGDGPRPAQIAQAGGPLTEALSRRDRRVIGREMHRALRALRQEPDQARIDFAPVIAALKASPYDAAAVSEALNRQIDTVFKRTGIGRDILLKRLENMSDSERAAYAERLERVLQRGPGGKPKGRREPWLD